MENNLPVEEIQKNLDSLSLDLQEFENKLIPQLDGLAKAIPEIYEGYATMVRTLVNSTMDLFKPKGRTGSRIAVAAEIGARSIEAYGKYKAAKEHNRLLAKYMTIKTTYAQNNLEKVKGILPKIERSNAQTAKLFMKCCSLNYRLDQFDNNRIERVAAIQLKALSLHRTNIYLLELCKYLVNEYQVWLKGEQRSKFDMPDYYMINDYLSKQIFGNNLLEAYSEAADTTETISGKQIMLLSDYQLSLMALGDKLCTVRPNKAVEPVRQLIENCGAHTFYSENTKDFTKHLNKKPYLLIVILGVVAALAITYICSYYLLSTEMVSLIMNLAGVSAVLRICFKGLRDCRIGYVMKGMQLAESTDSTIEAECGKVDRPDIDYNERNALEAAIKGFFK